MRKRSIVYAALAGLLWMMPSDVAGQAIVSTVYSFSNAGSNGFPLYVAPIQGRDGRLYGSTNGAPATGGALFREALGGPAKITYSFVEGSVQGQNPQFGLTLATDGNLYGVATGGQFGYGVLFRVGSGGGNYTVLHQFAGDGDGAYPTFPPIQASDGKFYGITQGVAGASTLYRYAAKEGFATLYSFTSDYGQSASCQLIETVDGTLYGCAGGGGINGNGTVFQITKAGVPLWRYQFSGGNDGYAPVGTLVLDAAGNLYGTTLNGGANGGLGTAYAIDQSRQLTVLHTFTRGADGNSPIGVSLGSDGMLYGAAAFGGPQDSGTLFRLSTSGSFQMLYPFRARGTKPLAAPIQAPNGLFYGTTSLGGKNSAGTIYSLDMGLAPFIALQQYQGRAGTTAQILGQGFTGTSGVTFNGVAATSFTVVSDTYMTAVVPTGATTGSVVVTTPTGTLTSNKMFTVTK